MPSTKNPTEEIAAAIAEAEAAEAAEAAKLAEAEEKKAVKVAKKKKPPFYVAPRKSLTSKRGILSGDTSDEVKAEYLSGGSVALAAFVKSGHVIKG